MLVVEEVFFQKTFVWRVPEGHFGVGAGRRTQSGTLGCWVVGVSTLGVTMATGGSWGVIGCSLGGSVVPKPPHSLDSILLRI